MRANNRPKNRIILKSLNFKISFVSYRNDLASFIQYVYQNKIIFLYIDTAIQQVLKILSHSGRK